MSADQDDSPPPAPPSSQGPLGEFVTFLAENKVWWMVPIGILVIAAVAIILLATTNVAPYIYTFF